MSTTVLAFDIGIRNLAWCLMTKTGTTYTIGGWQNYDLLAGEGHETSDIKQKCSVCSAKPTYENSAATLFCVRHCPPTRPALRDLSGNLLKKIPDLATIRALLEPKQVAGKDMKTKAGAVEKLAEHYSLPIQKQKVKKAVETALTTIHDGMRKFVSDNKTLFSTAKFICLENQPALKNPTMKSVQILLFATLRDILQPSPPQICLVHAGKKVKGAETGDAGYKARKEGSEARVRETFQKAGTISDSQRWSTYFAAHKKQNDLADAFCMCLDKLNG